MQNYVRKSQDTLYVCGAGISWKKPTCLPLGRELTQFYLANTCGDQACDLMLATTNRLARHLNRKIELPRLETVIGAINEMDVARNADSTRHQTMLSGFESFMYAPFNENHFSLAKLCLAGNTIITFNFDMCIEKAMEAITGKEVLVRKESGVQISIHEKHSRIVHLHGMCTNTETLGATIKDVLNGLPEEFEFMFTRIVSDYDKIVFVGYSFSDYFDFVPFIKSKEALCAKKKCIFVNHLGLDSDISNRLRSTFPNILFTYIETDTSEYLHQLAGGERYVSHADNFLWKKSFLDHIGFQYSENDVFINAAQVGNNLGIMPTIITGIDWPMLLARLKVVIPTNSTNEALKLISSIARDNGDMETYKHYRSFMSNRNKNLASEAFDNHEYIPQSSFDELMKECRRPIKIHYRHMLDIREYYTRVYDEAYKLILSSGLFNYSMLSDESRSMITDMSSLFDFLMSSSYKKFTGISQYAAILSVKYTFEALKYGTANIDLVNEELQICCEHSVYASLGRAYFHASRMHLILYFSSRNARMIDTAKHYYDMSVYVLKTCGHEYYLNKKSSSEYYRFLLSAIVDSSQMDR